METESKLKFHGLSSPDDLKRMWKELKHDNDNTDINIIWDYVQPEQLKPGFNIVNILYHPNFPDETGHYCLITVDVQDGRIYYFNPIADHSLDQTDKLFDLDNFCNHNLFIDMTGKQPITSSDCGYYCLTKAFNMYNNLQGGKLPENPTTKDYLADILKILRAIYFRKEVREGRIKPKSKNNQAAGLSDELPKDRVKAFGFQELKNKIEN